MIQHIAFIMDGNRRWAKGQGLALLKGHNVGMKKLKDMTEHIQKKGLKYMTVYALSTKNLKRSNVEVGVLFGLLKSYVKEEILDSDRFLEDGIRFKAIGRIDLLPQDVQELLLQAEAKTKDCNKFFFNVCLGYDGQEEIVDAVKRIVEDGIARDEITKEIVKRYLYTADIPAPDLIVRTGMYPEQRLSGFLLWDSSYAEFAFTKTYWPALSMEEIDKIIDDFSSRERRFGE